VTYAPSQLSRRFLLQGLAALAGTAVLPAFGTRRAHATIPSLPPDIGHGRTVAIIGAGVAGLTAGWVLARHGFRVTIYEANDRYGGRSLSPRPIREEYREWWFSKYDADRRFPKMYVAEFHEDPARSPDPQPQICRFDDPLWNPQSGKPPVELFLNAGPGRIPSDHVALIDLCRRTGVALEPYIFVSGYNLLQGDAFNGGVPIAFNQVDYSLIGEIAEMLAAAIKDGHMLGQDSKSYRDKVLQMLLHFGDLDGDYRYTGSPRIGYSHIPGGWRDPGVVNPVVPLNETLDSGFVGAGNPETSPGSFLFNSENIFWQTSLLQPVGGMNRIWQQLLLQEIPKMPSCCATMIPGRPTWRPATLAARANVMSATWSCSITRRLPSTTTRRNRRSASTMPGPIRRPARPGTASTPPISASRPWRPICWPLFRRPCPSGFARRWPRCSRPRRSRSAGRAAPGSGKPRTRSTAASAGPRTSSPRFGIRRRILPRTPAC
jgi:hypothetical protein